MEQDSFNYNFNEGTRKLQPEDYTCRYCKKVKTDSVSDNVILPITRVTKRTNLLVLKSVSYNKMELLVPRCENCRKIHKQAQLQTWILIILLAIGLSALSIMIWGLFGAFAILIIPAALTFAWDPIRNFFLKKHNIPDVFKGFNSEPFVQALNKEGWLVGKPLP